MSGWRPISPAPYLKPQSVEVRTGDGQVLADGAVLGPLLERTRVNVSCLVREGKPQPKVAWYFNGKEMLDVRILATAINRNNQRQNGGNQLGTKYHSL
ncbi:hypothetical protein RR48_03714 [Papilio machaon]|uniref:Ig-like domain-containing protein n=1 Tax=Papilio machaon TaxID=76193 RepID=A0A0N1PH68_PAPMA|nr:hypothetical protein RR48_03714 [Papilio machaon]